MAVLDCLEQLEFQVQLVLQGPLDLQVLREMLALLVQVVPQVRLVYLDHLEIRAVREVLVPLAHREVLDSRAAKVRWVHLVNLASKVFKVLQAAQDKKERRDP